MVIQRTPLSLSINTKEKCIEEKEEEREKEEKVLFWNRSISAEEREKGVGRECR
jgi:hypothetical protein